MTQRCRSRIITQRSVAAGAWYAFCNGAGFFMVVYYVPLWHQVIHGVSAGWSLASGFSLDGWCCDHDYDVWGGW